MTLFDKDDRQELIGSIAKLTNLGVSVSFSKKNMYVAIEPDGVFLDIVDCYVGTSSQDLDSSLKTIYDSVDILIDRIEATLDK